MNELRFVDFRRVPKILARILMILGEELKDDRLERRIWRGSYLLFTAIIYDTEKPPYL